MTRQTLRQGLIMVVSGLALYAVFFLGTNLIANAYIDQAAAKALLLEMQMYDAVQGSEEATGAPELIWNEDDSNFTVSFLYPSFIKDLAPDAIWPTTQTEQDLYGFYRTHQLPPGEITRLTIEEAVYYAVLTQENHTAQADEMAGETGVPTTPEDVILYTNVTNVQNLVRSIHVRLLPFVLVAIFLMGLLGIYSGRHIEDSQGKLKRFFMNASHELKTPLQSIQGYAEGLKSGVVQDNRMAGTVILQQSEKMRDLIDELLVLSTLESGAYQMKREPINLSDMLIECLYSLKPLADAKEIRLVPSFAQSLPEIVGDEIQLPKVFHTVLSNALNYAESEITIDIEKTKKHLVVRIADDGPGIDEKDLDRIFERFYVGTKSTGSGIGLAMAKEIIARSGGRIQAHENKPKGAVFEIFLPI